jgi:4-hydroxy-tetrahydrodipicolinate reductase
MRVIIYGAQGTMGSLAYTFGMNEGYDMIGVDPLSQDSNIVKDLESITSSDVIIDFSHPSQIDRLLQYAVSSKTPLVIATTGYDEAALKNIAEASKHIAVFKSANLSFGVHILKQILIDYTALLKNDYDIEIIEKHHKFKKDAPSGTALYLAQAIQAASNEDMDIISNRYDHLHERKTNEIGISSIRGGHIVGEHTIIFAGQEDIIEITHKAQSKMMFVKGSFKAALFTKDQKPGLYGMDDLIERG